MALVWQALKQFISCSAAMSWVGGVRMLLVGNIWGVRINSIVVYCIHFVLDF